MYYSEKTGFVDWLGRPLDNKTPYERFLEAAAKYDTETNHPATDALNWYKMTTKPYTPSQPKQDYTGLAVLLGIIAGLLLIGR